MATIEENSPWTYSPGPSGSTATAEKPAAPEAGPPAAGKQPPADVSISWTASEYIDHDRGLGWHAMLALVTALLAGLVYLISRDYTSIGIVVALAVVVAIFVRRKPKEVNYALDSSGLKIGDKQYGYNLFKSFTVIRQGALSSVTLMPVKRFMPPVTAYFAPQDEEQITSALGARLPYEDQKPSHIDNLSRRLKL